MYICNSQNGIDMKNFRVTKNWSETTGRTQRVEELVTSEDSKEIKLVSMNRLMQEDFISFDDIKSEFESMNLDFWVFDAGDYTLKCESIN